ncbi:hypothetical protein BDZ89DRAFT_1040034 [Hymenopellis radicata]|nr:hypothetical protein BDZ89DRAFT_1040034 [Hymenopellis radicata]
MGPTPYTADQQQQLEEDIADATASVGMPLSWVENLAVMRLFERHLPAASRKVLTKRIIPEVLAKRRMKAVYIIGESRKARRMLVRLRPWTPDCYAHQITLIVGDYLKFLPPMRKRYTQWATALITWLRSKTQVLGLIRRLQQENNLPVLAVIRAVLTRWTAHYLAFTRVAYWFCDQHYSSSAHESKTKNHLEPLAIAANITQSAFCRLDLLTFGYLFRHQSENLTDASDQPSKRAIIASIEKRWGKATAFKETDDTRPFMVPATMLLLLRRLYIRFFREDCPSNLNLLLDQNIKDYFGNRGLFAAQQASNDRTAPDPRDVYHGLVTVGQIPSVTTPLIRLGALHIYSICANSASCERLFIIMGNVLTKLRNRMGQDILKLPIRDEFVEDGESKAHNQDDDDDDEDMEFNNPGYLPPPLEDEEVMAAANPAARSAFDRIVNSLIERVEEDEEDTIDEIEEAAGDNGESISITIGNLFNFGETVFMLFGVSRKSWSFIDLSISMQTVMKGI